MKRKNNNKHGMWKITLIISAIIVIALVGGYLYIKYQTYDYMQIVDTHENTNIDNASYKKCVHGVLRYGRDGIALLTEEGEEIWNQPCQMNSPIIDMRGQSIAIGDKGGTNIMVFQKQGLKGEIQTTRPIEKIAVSSQGIVGAILSDEELPLVMCYDAKGNIVIENKVSLNKNGYPVDVSISEDGKAMLVSYLHTQDNAMVTKIVHYYFGKAHAENEDYQVQYQEIEGTIAPITTFLSKDISLVVTDSNLIFYSGLEKPEEIATIDLDGNIQSVAYDDELVAVVLKNNVSSNYKLNIYNTRGKMLSSVTTEKEYANIKMEDGQVIMYDGPMCSIYMKNGTHKFEGKMDENILEIFSDKGLNKYKVINASSFNKVKLAMIGEK